MKRGSSSAGLSPIARLSRQLAHQEKNRPAEPLVTPEAQRHGQFTEELIQGPDGVQNVTRRRGRGPLKQWRANGVFTPEQFHAIGEYERAKTALARTSHLVANYDGVSRGGNSELADLNRVSAIKFLKILELGALNYFDQDRLAVFDAIVIGECSTDEAALHFRQKIGSTQDRVRETVDMISTAISRVLKNGCLTMVRP